LSIEIGNIQTRFVVIKSGCMSAIVHSTHFATTAYGGEALTEG
jgi:hypothetical protein